MINISKIKPKFTNLYQALIKNKRKERYTFTNEQIEEFKKACCWNENSDFMKGK